MEIKKYLFVNSDFDCLFPSSNNIKSFKVIPSKVVIKEKKEGRREGNWVKNTVTSKEGRSSRNKRVGK